MGSAVPWNARTETRGVPARHTRVAFTPATGAIAANVPGIAHARLVAKMPPAEIPVAYTRFRSMQSVDSVRVSSALTNGTSLPGSGGNFQVLTCAPDPFGVTTT